MKSSVCPIVATLCLVLMASDTQASNISNVPKDPPTRVVVFGASFSDVGNIHEVIGKYPPAPHYDNGRFCNGPLWHDVAGDVLGWPDASASLLGGDVYSYGGAQTGAGVTTLPCFPDMPIPTIGDQITTFLDTNSIESSDLFVIGINNDLTFHVIGLGGNLPEVAVANMVEHIETLAMAGAESFLVMNMIPLGAIYEQAFVKWRAGVKRVRPTIYSASPRWACHSFACGAGLIHSSEFPRNSWHPRGPAVVPHVRLYFAIS